MAEVRTSSRPRRRVWGAFAALLLIPLATQCSSESQPPRNLVMIVVDTLRADALGLYGNPRPTSPRLDEFGREALVFDRAWAQGTYTPASFMSYMTSTYVRRHGWDYAVTRYPEAGVCGWDDLETLAEVLSRHGFATEALIANQALHAKNGFGRGFEVWNLARLDDLSDEQDLIIFQDLRVVREARHALEGWEPGRRHFLYLHLMAPHLPLLPSRAALRELEVPADWAPKGRVFHPYLQKITAGGTEAQKEGVRHGYYASVRDGDRHTGAILAAIEETGHADDTIVVFLSDHGEQLWEHGEYGHTWGVWEQLAHVPLVMRIPGRPHERVDDRAVGLLDVAPTLLELLGIEERPASWQGRSLFDPADGGAVITERFRTVGVTTDGRVKGVVVPVKKNPEWGYYDLERDPAEQNRLETVERSEDLQERFREWDVRTPRVERSPDEKPAGLCATATERERQEQEEALRALGYVE